MQRFGCAVCNSQTLLFSEEATLHLVTLQVGSSLSIFYTLHDQNLVYSRDKVMIQFISDTFTVNLKHLARHIKERIAKALQETKKKKKIKSFFKTTSIAYTVSFYIYGL